MTPVRPTAAWRRQSERKRKLGIFRHRLRFRNLRQLLSLCDIAADQEMARREWPDRGDA